MDEIKVVMGGEDTINLSPDMLDDDINIQLSTPRRKAPSRKRMKQRYAPPQPPPSIIEDPTMDAFINPAKAQIEDDEMSFGGGGSDHYSEHQYDEEQHQVPLTPQTQVESVPPSKGYESVDNERIDLLAKFARLDAKGIKIGKRFTAYSDIHEMRTEYQRLTYSSQLEASIKFQRRVLMAATTGGEFLNKRFNPFDVELDGWSENVMENIDEYDNIFEELFHQVQRKRPSCTGNPFVDDVGRIRHDVPLHQDHVQSSHAIHARCCQTKPRPGQKHGQCGCENGTTIPIQWRC